MLRRSLLLASAAITAGCAGNPFTGFDMAPGPPRDRDRLRRLDAAADQFGDVARLILRQRHAGRADEEGSHENTHDQSTL